MAQSLEQSLTRELAKPKLDKYSLYGVFKQRAIFVPMCGTREFNILLSFLCKIRTNQHTKQAIKSALSYAGDRDNTTGHVKVTRSAQRQRDPFVSKTTGASRGAGPNKATRKHYKIYRV